MTWSVPELSNKTHADVASALGRWGFFDGILLPIFLD